MSLSLPASDALLLCLVLAVIGQQIAIYFIRRREARREAIFRIITENAADMIALVDLKGRRQYNSPAYQKVLGYSPSELSATSAFEQIHPDDRFKVLEASRLARETGTGKRLQYRLRHKDGSWRILESTASAIKNSKGQVEQLVIVNRDVTDRKRLEQQADERSLRDPLTGLANRQLCTDRIQLACARAKRDAEYRFALLIIGLDNFSSLNESMEPGAVDGILVEAGRRIAAELRLDDTLSHSSDTDGSPDGLLSRFEFAEFTIVLENTSSASDAMRVAQRAQSAIAQPMRIGDREVALTASAGIVLSSSAHNPGDLLRDAATAMRRAQARGGGRCEVFDELMHTHAVRRLTLEDELDRALKRDEFILHYQPVFRLKNRQLHGFEALLRWRHPERGLVSPYDFMSVAEDMGLIALIDQWVIEQACRQLSAWQAGRAGAGPIVVAVNLSARQLANPALVQAFRVACSKSGVSPSQLQVEVAEQIATANPMLACNVLLQFKHLGVSRVLDDFGSGASSLSWLQRLPVSGLKIDRSIVSSMAVNRGNHEFLELVSAVAGKLSLRLSAEGIEAMSQVDPLIDVGCEFGQGYLFSPPLQADQAELLLSGRSATAGR